MNVCKPPFKRVSANALIITVIVALVLAVLCSLLITLAWYNYTWASMNKTEDRLYRNISSAANLVLADSSMEVTGDITTIDLFGDGNDSITIKKEGWGLFYFASTTASFNNKTKSRYFLYGPAPGKYFDGCLYVADHKRPVSLVGDVRLTGDAYLSKAGIKATYINQRGFAHAELLKGKIMNSNETLPELNQQVVGRLSALSALAINADKLSSSVPPAGDSLQQSFADSLLIIGRSGKYTIANTYFKGHILIASDSMIEVDASCGMENILLVAPVVRFNAGFSGSVQAIATDSIVVEENSVLHYPSALVLRSEAGNKDLKRMRIEKGSRVNGIVLSYSDSTDFVRTYVEIAASAQVTGIVYVNGFLETRGTVYGSVLTDFFIYRSTSTVYENHLVDIEINRQKLSEFFIGSPVFGNRKNGIIEWLQ